MRWATFAAAIVALYAGAAALVRSGIGADPYGAFVSSFARWGLTPGAATAAFTAAAIVACSIAGVRARAGTIAAAIAGPILFDTFWVVLEDHSGAALWAVGFAVVVTAAGTIAATGVGPGAPEHVVLTAATRGANLRLVTWVRDAAFVAVAAALGGPVGAGTVIAVVAISPTFTWTYRAAARILGPAPATGGTSA